jgi:prepilin-type N-terminal cleavage/methylation domain-containing protein
MTIPRPASTLLFPAQKSYAGGFTLLEVIMVVMIGVMLALLAIPSIQGVIAERKMDERILAFNEFVREAQNRATSEQRAWVIVWDECELTLQPDEPTEEELEAGGASVTVQFPLSDGESYAIDRPAALVKEPNREWTFWRSGTCEPATIHYSGPLGSWSARYDPLTAQPEILNQSLAP